MKLFDYKPKANFEGIVQIEIPSYKERLNLLKSFNFSINSEGQVDSKDLTDGAIGMIELVEKHVKSISLKMNDELFENIEQLG